MKSVIMFIVFFFIALTGFTQVNLPFKVTKSNLLVVGVTLNGKYVMMLVDCGSEITILEKSQADIFGFKEADTDDTENSDWSGHSVGLSKVQYATIQIGSIKVYDNIKAADIKKLLSGISATVKANVIGIIGSDVLRANKLIVDYNTMSLHN